MDKKEACSEITLTAIQNIPEINPGDDVSRIINQCLLDQEYGLRNNDLIVIAQKIISKSENRFIDLKTIEPSEEAIKLAKQTDKDPRLAELILRESNRIIRAEKGTIIVEHKLGHILANAGIDRSNIGRRNDYALLLPKDPDGSAIKIKKSLETKNVK